MSEMTDKRTNWYVIQAMSGKEKKVFAQLDYNFSQDAANVILDETGEKKTLHSYFQGMIAGVYELVLPYERIEDRRPISKDESKKASSSKKDNGKEKKEKFKIRLLYPGYILVRMKLHDENDKLINENLRAIRDVNGVIGLLGGVIPTPISQEEAENLLKCESETERNMGKTKVEFEVGKSVIINNGAFEGSEAIIEAVDDEHKRLKLSVSIFGRFTPVDVEYWQVELHTPEA